MGYDHGTCFQQNVDGDHRTVPVPCKGLKTTTGRVTEQTSVCERIAMPASRFPSVGRAVVEQLQNKEGSGAKQSPGRSPGADQQTRGWGSCGADTLRSVTQPQRGRSSPLMWPRGWAGGYPAARSQSDRERHVPSASTYVWDLKSEISEQTK